MNPVGCLKCAGTLALSLVFLFGLGVEAPEDLVIFLLALMALLVL